MIRSFLFKVGKKNKFRKLAHTEKKNQVTQIGLQIQVIFSDEFKWKKHGRISKMRNIFPIPSTWNLTVLLFQKYWKDILSPKY